MKRILSIDGGGIKGVFPASFLSTIEQHSGGDIAKYFDLIVGTSTGGIIALALGLGLAAKETLQFYEVHGPTIFGGRRIFRAFRHWGFSKYNRKPLEDALTSVFGEKTIGDSRSRLVIPSLNAETNEVHVWKTCHHPRFQLDRTRQTVEAALATASAPTYFPTYQPASGIPLIDGGVWANNPIVVALVEALGILKWSPSEVRILSLGCTTTAMDMRWTLSRFSGKLTWAAKVADVFMAAQASSALGMAQHLVSDRNQIVRISPQVGNRYELDNPKQIPVLRGLGVTEARKALPLIQELFLQQEAEPFTPYTSSVPH